MGRYVALLRGINVGGNNLIKMVALKACFEAQGFRDVVTYLQSGNVVFTGGGPAASLTQRYYPAFHVAWHDRATGSGSVCSWGARG